MHFDLDDAVALAGLAAPAFHVEGETPRTVTALARHGHARKKLADRREQRRVGRRVGARGAADRALVDAHRLVEELLPLDRIVRGGLVYRAVELARDGVIERVVDEGRFTRAGDAAHAHEQAYRQREIDILEIVPARPAQLEDPRPVETAAGLGHGDLERAREVLTGEGGGVPADLLGRPLRDHLAAVLARSRSHVEDVIGRVDRLFVVLDYDDSVAEVAQVLERGEEAGVVALVQADRGLVEHVHDAGEPRADLAGEADTLRLAARERVRAAVERQIVEADVVEEVEPRDDLVDDFLGDGLLAAFELELAEEFERLLQGEPAHLVDRAVVDLDVPRFRAKPRPPAGGAGLGVQVFRELLAHHQGIGLLVAALEAGQDALEGVLFHDRAAALAQVGERDFLLRAVEHERLDRLGEFLERRLDVEPEMRGEAREHLEIELVAPVPALDRAAGEAQARVRDHAPGIEEADRAQAVALRAGAHGIVEGEKARLEFGQRVVADGAGVARRE